MPRESFVWINTKSSPFLIHRFRADNNDASFWIGRVLSSHQPLVRQRTAFWDIIQFCAYLLQLSIDQFSLINTEKIKVHHAYLKSLPILSFFRFFQWLADFPVHGQNSWKRESRVCCQAVSYANSQKAQKYLYSDCQIELISYLLYA